jgi:hypothetical protein
MPKQRKIMKMLEDINFDILFFCIVSKRGYMKKVVEGKDIRKISKLNNIINSTWRNLKFSHFNIWPNMCQKG